MKLLSLGRHSFVTLEFLLVALVSYLIWRPADVSIRFSDALIFSTEALQYLALIPVATLVWCLAEGKAILFPPSASVSLHEWPGFGRLKSRVIIGLIYQLLFTAAALVAWVFPYWGPYERSILLLGSVVGSLIVGGSFFLASVAVRVILARKTRSTA